MIGEQADDALPYKSSSAQHSHAPFFRDTLRQGFSSRTLIQINRACAARLRLSRIFVKAHVSS
jgi:hypothetical protein